MKLYIVTIFAVLCGVLTLYHQVIKGDYSKATYFLILSLYFASEVKGE